MSLLNMANDGLHGVLIVLYSYLLRKSRAKENEILDACAPKALSPDQKQARQTLRTWKDLGLFVESDGIYTLSSDLPVAARNEDLGLARLPRTSREIVLREENNQRFWESTDSKAADLIRGVAWALAQNVHIFTTATRQAVEEIEQSQIQDESIRIFQNDTRWNGFRYWAAFLGFGRTGKAGQSVIFLPDPTLAVADCLPEVFGGKHELRAATFLENLGRCLPVVDGGTYRRQVEERLDAEAWHPPAPGYVTSSLGRALRRLRLGGVITLEDRADADKLRLPDPSGEVLAFSHVILKQEQ